MLLIAKEKIPAGCEVRTDYDRGDKASPFRAKMLKDGVPAIVLDSADYKAQRWQQPEEVSGLSALVD